MEQRVLLDMQGQASGTSHLESTPRRRRAVTWFRCPTLSPAVYQVELPGRLALHNGVCSSCRYAASKYLGVVMNQTALLYTLLYGTLGLLQGLLQPASEQQGTPYQWSCRHMWGRKPNTKETWIHMGTPAAGQPCWHLQLGGDPQIQLAKAPCLVPADTDGHQSCSLQLSRCTHEGWLTTVWDGKLDGVKKKPEAWV
jgi:hypothetical protein